MKVLLLSPLYPPDTGVQAQYVKELTRRLSRSHEVALLVYGEIPEHIPSVAISPISKRKSLPARMYRFLLAVRLMAKEADVLIVENGPSVELPFWLASFQIKKPYIFHTGDIDSYRRSQHSLLRSFLLRLISKRAVAVLSSVPPPRPEVLPFVQLPEKVLRDYETAWHKHLDEVTLHAKRYE